ncbi:MAG TPA: amino acid adenylation domain-containing protein, partial [Pyrinomonadaceae bacterium]|nr:amino acid adenylation domain-containing protein [Pyrinomonadaceae bacterium]
MQLERLPLTANGKVDRRALPAVEQVREETETEVAQTPVEEMLVGIWSEVLGVRVGVADDFFELGGHSLLATQVISQIREVFQVELPLRALFEAPTVASLSKRVELAIKAGQGLELPPIELVSRTEPLPLSFAQQRLWFIEQYEPGRATYNVPLMLRLDGPLNVNALEQSFTEIIRRHESLRTTFAVQDGQPVQVINAPRPFTIPLIDLSEWPLAAREEEARKLAQVEAGRSFSLSTGPLLRVTLVRLGENEHLALVTMHHIVSDGWSLGVLVREVGTLYEAYSRGAESPLAELPLQYADYAVWQRGWLKDEVLEQQLSYWREQLAAAPVLELPTDRVRPAAPSYSGATQSLQVSREVLAELKALSRREGVTLFMTLLAAFQTLLSRLSGQEDIVVGTGIANRTRGEVEGLIGFFVNTLALRTDLTGDPSFRQLLGRVREVTLGAYGHQDVPFEKLVEELDPQRGAGHMRLFQVMFAMPNMPMPELQLAGVTLSAEERESETAKFDLMLAATEGDEALGFKLEYSTELFDEETVKRLLKHLATLLDHIVEDADQRLSALRVLTHAEEKQVLLDWNQTTAPYPREHSIHELFQSQAAETPEAVAVVAGETRLTYAELNRRANQLAHYLQSLGVSAEVRVGICLERSASLIVGLLAILKAGGAYVPLDPSYPEARLKLMIEDAGVELVLTTAQFATLFDETVRVIDLDQAQETIASYSPDDPQTHLGPENLAYVMYTSGSTGRPKGVSITHRNVVRLVRDTDYVTLEPSDRIAQASNSAFDASTFEIWGSLLNGARLVIIRREVAISPDEFAAELEKQGITVLFLTTALFNQIARRIPEAFASLRYVLFGGEAVDPQWVREVLAKGAPGQLLHVYGPTENTTFSSWFPVSNVPGSTHTVPIGKPIMNTQAYVLDQRLQPVPIGVVGELYVGGDGLMRGYLNEPALTAEKLIPHPHSSRAGERLYRTGDLARLLSDGSIEFIGRADSQVKIRGFRIEPDEVAAVLREQGGIEDCLVLVKRSPAGDRQLVAYCATNGHGGNGVESATQLRKQLQQKLPEYMVPAQFVMMDHLPLTPNGKVDRQMLAALETIEPETETEFIPAKTPVEELLANIFANVLHVESVGANDDFFELGGHSLLATQVMSRVREAFGV